LVSRGRLLRPDVRGRVIRINVAEVPATDAGGEFLCVVSGVWMVYAWFGEGRLIRQKRRSRWP
jgi:hypothetical protein